MAKAPSGNDGNNNEEQGSDRLPTRRSCAAHKVHRRLLNDSPRYAEARQRIEEQAFMAEHMLGAQRSGCTEIPVVVHVVWNTAAQNISQDQIDSQIRVLNDDFRKRNADISSAPAPFVPIAADARIMFKLATTDPNGAPTNGVTRTQTQLASFGDDDAVKSAGTGGADPWPSSEYLNIWVCQLGGGLLGYAQFPGGPPETDGVVVTHTGFGTTGTAAAPFNRGRTTTHEVGHWLNLRHIWGDDGEGCSGSDFVADTPNQGGPNYGVPTFPTVSCSNGPNGDMFMNYMDYVDDAAMVMFTAGQVTRMQAALDGPRSSIGSSVSCGGKPLPKDIGKELPKELPKEFAKERPKDFPKEPVKELPKEWSKERPKDFPKEPIKELPKDFPKDRPKDIIKDQPKDAPKDFPKDRPKDIIKELPKDLGLDPQKKLFENPKTFVEGPGGFGGPVTQPGGWQGGGPQFGGGGQTPFVLGTGGGGRQEDASRQQVTLACAQLLQALSQLAAQNLLDEEGLAMMQQLWATYEQLEGGQS